MRRLLLAAMVLAAVAAVGCKNAADEDDGPSVVPKAVAFEGKVDPKFAGDWTSEDGSSSLSLQKDGAAKIAMTSSSQNGKSTAHYDGNWLISGESLLLKYVDGSQGDTTLKYAAKLSAGKLALKHGSTTTSYTRR